MQKYTELVGSISTTGKPPNMMQPAMGSSSQACQMGNVPLSHPQIQTRTPGNHSPTLMQGASSIELSPQLEQGNVR
jgi:hypothetical protein